MFKYIYIYFIHTSTNLPSQVRAKQIKAKHDKYGTYQERFGGKNKHIWY